METKFKKTIFRFKIFRFTLFIRRFTNILIDAINNGIPCLASDCSGSDDILKGNKSGLIFGINNKFELLKLMNKLHENYNFYNHNAVKFVKKSNRFLINPQSEKYLKFFIIK